VHLSESTRSSKVANESLAGIGPSLSSNIGELCLKKVADE